MGKEQELRHLQAEICQALLDAFPMDDKVADAHAAVAAKVVTARRDEQAEVVGHTANCCNCGRIIDTREEAEGGDKFGAEASDGRWLCSMECWDAVFRDEGPYASPPAVAAGGVTEALRSAMGMCEQYADFIRRVPAAEIDQHPYLPELEQVIEVARAALAVGDEGVREALARIIDANDDYLRHNPHGDPDALTVACDAARRFLPTPPSRGEGV